MHNHRTLARPDRARAQRIIHAYASKAARIIANHDDRPGLEVERLVDQTRRQLAVRLWDDITHTEFWGLAQSIAEFRTYRAASWDTVADSPSEKAAQLGRFRELITAEIDAMTWNYPTSVAVPNAAHRIAS
ncbi:hypothetical protein SCMU_14630 [Sinomonas cyclohexanicum]|uniref:Uncharacterized protein n=1 Tax=Sinomonas cyclohexanicum TaxID=322009 RepID=A0ABN6FFS5_SINCY|nr:hypothetical protein [Corynebacterium cyclohexanicum]BCT75621.1 hypothetical protein SCMU_14630 [Corynebacterium cyclohexanicum]